MIRQCLDIDANRIAEVINEAAKAYRGHIPDDCWRDPYMPLQELEEEMKVMTFFGWDSPERNRLVGVMGYQPGNGVTLIRHAYVLPQYQGKGIGGQLISRLTRISTGRLLIGTWKAATWAIRFYESHGFRALSDEESQELLHRYWRVPERQRQESVVLEWEG
jgi:GNAT superfamily N-acetyltransferase